MGFLQVLFPSQFSNNIIFIKIRRFHYSPPIYCTYIRAFDTDSLYKVHIKAYAYGLYILHIRAFGTLYTVHKNHGGQGHVVRVSLQGLRQQRLVLVVLRIVEAPARCSHGNAIETKARCSHM